MTIPCFIGHNHVAAHYHNSSFQMNRGAAWKSGAFSTMGSVAALPSPMTIDRFSSTGGSNCGSVKATEHNVELTPPHKIGARTLCATPPPSVQCSPMRYVLRSHIRRDGDVGRTTINCWKIGASRYMVP